MMKLSKKITAILMIGLFSAFLAGCSQDGQSADAAKPDTGAVQASTADASSSASKKGTIEDKDIVGVWINHIDTDINQRLPFMPTIHGPKISITWITSIPGPGRLRGTTAST